MLPHSFPSVYAALLVRTHTQRGTLRNLNTLGGCTLLVTLCRWGPRERLLVCFETYCVGYFFESKCVCVGDWKEVNVANCSPMGKGHEARISFRAYIVRTGL